MQNRKRKDPTPDDTGFIFMATPKKSYVLSDYVYSEPVKKLAKTDSAVPVSFYSSSSSSDTNDDEQKQPESDVVMYDASSSSSSSTITAVPPAQHEVFTKDQYVILILAFLSAEQRLLASRVSRLFKRCSENGATSAPQVLSDDGTRAPAAKVAALYKKCVGLTLQFYHPSYDANRAHGISAWRSQFINALSLDHLRALTLVPSTFMPNPIAWQFATMKTLASKTPKLTDLVINAYMLPDVVRSFLAGPRANKLQYVQLTLTVPPCAHTFINCVQNLQSVHKLHLVCEFADGKTMSSVLEAIRTLPTLSEFVLKWRSFALSTDHCDALRCLLEKHQHTLRKIDITAGATLNPDFSLWLIKCAGECKSLVDFTANTFYIEACVKAAADTVARLSDQLENFSICTDPYCHRLPDNRIGTIPKEALTDFAVACRSATQLVHSCIDIVDLPVRDLRNGRVSSTLILPDDKTYRMSLPSAAYLLGAFFDGCPAIKRVMFSARWKQVDAELAIAHLMHRLPAVQDLWGNPRTTKLDETPSALLAAFMTHPTWSTVSVPEWQGRDESILVYTKDELVDQTRPLTLLDENHHNWTICALAVRDNPRITIDTSRWVPTNERLNYISSSVNKPIAVDVICTGPLSCHPANMLDFAEAVALSTQANFQWTENGVPLSTEIDSPPAGPIVIRSSMRNVADYLRIQHDTRRNEVPDVLLLYDSVDQPVNTDGMLDFFGAWIKSLKYRRHYVSCRLEVEGLPMAVAPSPAAMYPFEIVCNSMSLGFARTIHVHGEQFSLSLVPGIDSHLSILDKLPLRLLAKGEFVRQFPPDTRFDAGGSFHNRRHVETFEVSVASLDELAACVWSVGQGRTTIVRMCAPESSPEQFEEIGERFRALLCPCIADKASNCYQGKVEFTEDVAARQLVSTITVAGEDVSMAHRRNMID
jgi:hypothetical protein